MACLMDGRNLYKKVTFTADGSVGLEKIGFTRRSPLQPMSEGLLDGWNLNMKVAFTADE
jgi:hypothetical protein